MSDLLAIGSSATQLYRVALTTVGNNIANLDNPAYSRQETAISDNATARIGVLNIGTGARLDAIRRNYDQFVEGSLRRSTSSVNTDTQLIAYTTRVLDLVASDEGSLVSAVDRLFTSMGRLALEPASIALRSDMLASTQFLAARIRELATGVGSVDADSLRELQSGVDSVNGLANALLTVNRQLDRNPELKQQPPQLLDQRDELLRQLSALMTIDVQENANGSVVVRVGGSSTQGVLVDGQRTRELALLQAPVQGAIQGFVLDPYGSNSFVGLPDHGSLAGLVRLRNDVLQPLVEELDYLALTLADELNLRHRAGLDLENRLGGDLFEFRPTVAVFDARGNKAEGIQTSTQPGAGIGPSELLHLGEGRWRVTDLASGAATVIVEQATAEGRLLTYDGIEMRIVAPQSPGVSYRLQAASRPAQDLQAAIADPRHLAVAGRLRVEQDPDNTRRLAIDLAYEPVAATNSLPGLSLALMQGRNLETSLALNAVGPVLAVPAGFGPFEVSLLAPLDAPVSLQVLTERFAHVAGSGALPAQWPQNLYGSDRYTAANLNQAFPGLELFIGARGQQELQTLSLPVWPAGTGIAAGALTLNGTALGALAAPADSRDLAQHIAAWINAGNTGVSATAVNLIRVPPDQLDLSRDLTINGTAIARAVKPAELVANINAASGTTGVRAWLDPEGYVQLENVEGQAGRSITLAPGPNALGLPAGELRGSVLFKAEGLVAFGLGAAGTSSDLARLGLATTLYGTNTGAEALHVYLGGGNGSTQAVRLKAESFLPAPERRIEQPFTLSFHEDAGQLYYRVTDIASGAVLHQRNYDHDAGVRVGELRLRFGLPPAAGDSFRVEPNFDARGDNANLRAMAAMADAPLFRNQSLRTYYVNEVGRIGSVVELARMNQAAAEIVHEETVARRAGIAGVNLDQEATDLLRYQQAFQAAAQVIQVANRLFDAILGVR